MFCPKCGQWNAGSAAQCTACGASLLPPGVGNPSAPPQPMPSAPNVPEVPPRPVIPPMGTPPSPTGQPMPPYNAAPPAYPNYPAAQPVYPNSGPAASYGPQYPTQPYPNYPPGQAPYPSAAPSGAPSASPPAYPTYSPLPPSAPYGTMPPSPYGGQYPPQGMPNAYGGGYPGQMPRASQCKVCGASLGYGVLVCPYCTVPVGMIANPYDPTVTTYLDARALNLPGSSPVYAAPGAYAGRSADPRSNVPEEVRKGWNWAAALNSTLWSFTHRAPGWGLLGAGSLFVWVMMIIGISTMSASDLAGSSKDSADDLIVGLVFLGFVVLGWVVKTLYLGNQGNAIAWRSGRYTNVSQLKISQRQWTSWSVVVFVTASIVLITATYVAGKH